MPSHRIIMLVTVAIVAYLVGVMYPSFGQSAVSKIKGVTGL